MKTIELNIKGMTCSGCKNSVERVLNRQEAVKKAIVDLDKEKAMVSFDETLLSVDEMIAIINRLDFKASVA